MHASTRIALLIINQMNFISGRHLRKLFLTINRGLDVNVWFEHHCDQGCFSCADIKNICFSLAVVRVLVMVKTAREIMFRCYWLLDDDN